MAFSHLLQKAPYFNPSAFNTPSRSSPRAGPSTSRQEHRSSATRHPRSSLVDPYKSLSANDFDDFVDDVSSKIRNALTYDPNKDAKQRRGYKEDREYWLEMGGEPGNFLNGQFKQEESGLTDDAEAADVTFADHGRAEQDVESLHSPVGSYQDAQSAHSTKGPDAFDSAIESSAAEGIFNDTVQTTEDLGSSPPATTQAGQHLYPSLTSLQEDTPQVLSPFTDFVPASALLNDDTGRKVVAAVEDEAYDHNNDEVRTQAYTEDLILPELNGEANDTLPIDALLDAAEANSNDHFDTSALDVEEEIQSIIKEDELEQQLDEQLEEQLGTRRHSSELEEINVNPEDAAVGKQARSESAVIEIGSSSEEEEDASVEEEEEEEEDSEFSQDEVEAPEDPERGTLPLYSSHMIDSGDARSAPIPSQARLLNERTRNRLDPEARQASGYDSQEESSDEEEEVLASDADEDEIAREFRDMKRKMKYNRQTIEEQDQEDAYFALEDTDSGREEDEEEADDESGEDRRSSGEGADSASSHGTAASDRVKRKWNQELEDELEDEEVAEAERYGSGSLEDRVPIPPFMKKRKGEHDYDIRSGSSSDEDGSEVDEDVDEEPATGMEDASLLETLHQGAEYSGAYGPDEQENLTIFSILPHEVQPINGKSTQDNPVVNIDSNDEEDRNISPDSPTSPPAVETEAIIPAVYTANPEDSFNGQSKTPDAQDLVETMLQEAQHEVEVVAEQMQIVSDQEDIQALIHNVLSGYVSPPANLMQHDGPATVPANATDGSGHPLLSYDTSVLDTASFPEQQAFNHSQRSPDMPNSIFDEYLANLTSPQEVNHSLPVPDASVETPAEFTPLPPVPLDDQGETSEIGGISHAAEVESSGGPEEILTSAPTAVSAVIGEELTFPHEGVVLSEDTTLQVSEKTPTALPQQVTKTEDEDESSVTPSGVPQDGKISETTTEKDENAGAGELKPSTTQPPASALAELETEPSVDDKVADAGWVLIGEDATRDAKEADVETDVESSIVTDQRRSTTECQETNADAKDEKILTPFQKDDAEQVRTLDESKEAVYETDQASAQEITDSLKNEATAEMEAENQDEGSPDFDASALIATPDSRSTLRRPTPQADQEDEDSKLGLVETTPRRSLNAILPGAWDPSTPIRFGGASIEAAVREAAYDPDRSDNLRDSLEMMRDRKVDPGAAADTTALPAEVAEEKTSVATAPDFIPLEAEDSDEDTKPQGNDLQKDLQGTNGSKGGITVGKVNVDNADDSRGHAVTDVLREESSLPAMAPIARAHQASEKSPSAQISEEPPTENIKSDTSLEEIPSADQKEATANPSGSPITPAKVRKSSMTLRSAARQILKKEVLGTQKGSDIVVDEGHVEENQEARGGDAETILPATPERSPNTHQKRTSVSIPATEMEEPSTPGEEFEVASLLVKTSKPRPHAHGGRQRRRSPSASRVSARAAYSPQRRNADLPDPSSSPSHVQTRSQCVYHKISIPHPMQPSAGDTPLRRFSTRLARAVERVSEGSETLQPYIFLVPACVSADKQDEMREAGILDLGPASAADQGAAMKVTGEDVSAIEGIPDSVVHCLKRVVGTDMIREGEVELLSSQASDEANQTSSQDQATSGDKKRKRESDVSAQSTPSKRPGSSATGARS